MGSRAGGEAQRQRACGRAPRRRRCSSPQAHPAAMLDRWVAPRARARDSLPRPQVRVPRPQPPECYAAPASPLLPTELIRRSDQGLRRPGRSCGAGSFGDGLGKGLRTLNRLCRGVTGADHAQLEAESERCRVAADGGGASPGSRAACLAATSVISDASATPHTHNAPTCPPPVVYDCWDGTL